MFFPTIALNTNPLGVVLAAGFAEDSESHTEILRGEQDPEEVFFPVCCGLRSLHGSDCKDSSSALRWLLCLMQAARAIKVT